MGSFAKKKTIPIVQTQKMKTFIFFATVVVLTAYSSPVPNPKPQISWNFDYSLDCYGSQCQQNNNGGGGYNNYDYDYYGGQNNNYGGGRFQGGNGGRIRGNGVGIGGGGNNQNCVGSQCQQNFGSERGIGGGVARGTKQNCVGSQCQQNFGGKDHSNFFSDSFWDRRRNGRNRRY